MDNRVSDELVERMVALVRDMAGEWKPGIHYAAQVEPWRVEALVIAELLPEPVDPDLLEAREIVARSHDVWADSSVWHANEAEQTRAGRFDACFRVADTLAGIKRGRELATQDEGAGK